MPTAHPSPSTRSRWRGLLTLVLVGAAAYYGLRVSAREAPDEGAPPRPADPAQVYLPSRVPDRIVLTMTDDPARSMAVTWRTSQEVARGLAEIAEAGAGPDFTAAAKEIRATREDLKTDLGQARYHSVVFQELAPKTKYAYRVGDGANWSEWFHFTTASTEPEPFSFVYFGDAQNDIKSQWSRVVREAQGDAPKARFLLHAGDLINHANADLEWGEWFAAAGWLNGMIPNVPVAGNHEYANNPLGKSTLSRHWRPQFALPQNGPAEYPESVYSFDYQGVRIIVLDSNVPTTPQQAFLENRLQSNPCRWTIVTLHAPLFSSAKDRDNPKLREAYKPLLDKYRVDLVLQGHDHTYARTGRVVPPGAAADFPPGFDIENVPEGISAVEASVGTVYVVSVSGPKMYYATRKPFMQRIAENTQLYQILHVDGDELRYEARTAIGDLYDAFTLKKRAGQTNELIDQIPATPERRWTTIR